MKIKETPPAPTRGQGEAPAQAILRLRGLSGEFAGTTWASSDTITVGRNSGLKLFLNDTSVSRWHAELALTPGGWVVHDLGSRNKTFLNGNTIGSDRAKVQAGDFLQFGNISLLVETAFAPNPDDGSFLEEYQIEKSQTGLSFSTIGNVTLKGKSIYSFTHYNVTSGTIFYRIKSVDFDGRSKYSGIIKISGNSANSYANRLAIYPVPAKNEVMVEHWKLSLNAKMIITSVDGKILKLVIPAVGSSHTPVNISDMPTGIYFLRIEDGAHEVQTVKLIRN